MRIYLTVGIVALLLTGGACRKAAAKLAGVQGTVLDSESGTPITDAAVVAFSPSDIAEEQAWTRIEGRTDATGKFILRSGLAERSYEIRVFKPGYLTRQLSVEMPALEKTRVADPVRLIRLPSSLSGTVLHCATEQPVAGLVLKIRVAADDPTAWGLTMRRTAAGSEGASATPAFAGTEKAVTSDGTGRFAFDGLAPQHAFTYLELAAGGHAIGVPHRWNVGSTADEMEDPIWVCDTPDPEAVAWDWHGGPPAAWPTIRLRLRRSVLNFGRYMGWYGVQWGPDDLGDYRIPATQLASSHVVKQGTILGARMPAGAELLAIPVELYHGTGLLGLQGENPMGPGAAEPTRLRQAFSTTDGTPFDVFRLDVPQGWYVVATATCTARGRPESGEDCNFGREDPEAVILNVVEQLPPVPAAGQAGTPAETAATATLHGYDVSLAFGVDEAHNLLPEEKERVRDRVLSVGPNVRACILGLRQEGSCALPAVPVSVDLMVMIDQDGSVVGTRIVPGKNATAESCPGVVNCALDALVGLREVASSGFAGVRQAYVTMTVSVSPNAPAGHPAIPDPEHLRAGIPGAGTEIPDPGGDP